MSAQTPGIAFLEEHLERRFDGMRFGRYSSRPIGKREWTSPNDRASQHGFNNALDLWHPDPNASQAQMYSYLDVVNAYLEEMHAQFALNQRLWRRPDHHNHIHIDIFPTGIGHPYASPWGPSTPAGHRWRTRSGLVITGARPPWDGTLVGGGINMNEITDATWLEMGKHFPQEEWSYYTSKGDRNGARATYEEKVHAFNLWMQRMSRALKPI